MRKISMAAAGIVAVTTAAAISSPALASSPDDTSARQAATLVGAVAGPGAGSVSTAGNVITAKGLRITIVGAKGEAAKVGGRVAWDGKVDHVAQGIKGGVQALSVFSSASSNKVSYRFAGADLTKNADGSVTVWRAGQVKKAAPLALVKAPWAKDANGVNVATSYKVKGDLLVQRVNFTERTAFPVVADPSIVKKWYGWQIRFSKSETQKIGYGAAACAVVASGIPDPTASKIVAAACGALTLAADIALDNGNCLAVNVFYTGNAVPWYWNC